MSRCVLLLLLVIVVWPGCRSEEEPSISPAVAAPEPAPAPAADRAREHTLHGTVLRKPATRTAECWRAGGGEYHVLAVADIEALPGPRSAREGVILQPSDGVTSDDLDGFVGVEVRCRGRFVTGKPVELPPDYRGAVPSPRYDDAGNLVGSDLRVGGGFEVLVVMAVEDAGGARD